MCLMVLGRGFQGAVTEPGDVLLAGTVLGWHRDVKQLARVSQLSSGGVH